IAGRRADRRALLRRSELPRLRRAAGRSLPAVRAATRLRLNDRAIGPRIFGGEALTHAGKSGFPGPMAPPLLHLQNIDLSFGGTPLLAEAELAVAPQERLCLVGRNGSGKSTLLKIAAGMIEPDRGTRFVQPSVTISYLPQEPDLTGFADTLSYVDSGLSAGH